MSIQKEKPSLFLALSFIFLLTFFFPPKSLLVSSTQQIHVHKNIQIANSHCQDTLYPKLCISTLSLIPNLHKKSIPEIISSNVNVTMNEVKSSAENCSNILHHMSKLDPIEKRALDDCIELLGDTTIDELQTTLNDLSTKNSSNSPLKHYNDLQTLLSGAMTNQDTCLEGIHKTKHKLSQYIEKNLHTISHHVSNSLAMLKKLKTGSSKGSSSNSNEVFPEYGTMKNGYPKWLQKKDRTLLQAPLNQIKFNLVVAKDGSGNFTTINAALSAAPNSTSTRFVIYIKAGTYFEYIDVERKKSMIMFIGDGIGKTVIKGNRNVVDGWTTFRSATVAVVGKGFLARGITFENYAGPSKHQAVALRSGSDLSAFYQCSFIAYQDTLYVHSLRQFYRDCDVFGTVDFIFVFDVTKHGARPDPTADSTRGFMMAWRAACQSTGPAKVVIPPGTFTTGETIFQGPCTCPKPIIIEIQGTVLSNTDISLYSRASWISLEHVDGVVITGGGTLNGQGNASWQYADKSGSAPPLPISLVFQTVKSSSINGINFVDSKGVHLKITDSNDITVSKIKITAPTTSPNTDGIHISETININVTDSNIGTGDDCISVGHGTTNVFVNNIHCGPGHGISIGSLGKRPDEKDVTKVYIKNCTFHSTTNGARIKTYMDSSPLQVSDVVYEDIVLEDVKNPILIDQHYNSKNKVEPSKVKLKDIHFKNIRGTTNSKAPVSLNCSEAAPCEGVELTDINIAPSGTTGPLQGATCQNAKAVFNGKTNVPPCK